MHSKNLFLLQQVQQRATGLTRARLYWENDHLRRLIKCPRMIRSPATAASLSVSNSTANALPMVKFVARLVRVYAATIRRDLRVYDQRLEI